MGMDSTVSTANPNKWDSPGIDFW